MSTRIWLLTGPPGIGKSTVLSRVVFILRSNGYGVGGCLARERRRGRERVSFTITDLLSGMEGVLASVEGVLGPKVGKYRVNISALAEIGAGALRDASERADAIAIDEIGPMELTSPEFRASVDACLASGKPVVAVMHEMMKDPLIEKVREMAEKEVIEVTLHNREGLAEKIAAGILESLRASANA